VKEMNNYRTKKGSEVVVRGRGGEGSWGGGSPTATCLAVWAGGCTAWKRVEIMLEKKSHKRGVSFKDPTLDDGKEVEWSGDKTSCNHDDRCPKVKKDQWTVSESNQLTLK